MYMRNFIIEPIHGLLKIFNQGRGRTGEIAPLIFGA